MKNLQKKSVKFGHTVVLIYFLNLLLASASTNLNNFDFSDPDDGINAYSSADLPIARAGDAQDAKLIFSSDFEGTSAILSLSDQTDRYTLDNLTSKSLLPRLTFAYEGGAAKNRYARIVSDPDNPSNNVLKFWLASANAANATKGRIQATVLFKPYVKEVYQKVRFKLGNGFETIKTWNKAVSWLTLLEIWNNNTWDNLPDPFRLRFDIVKPDSKSNTQLYFGVTSQSYNYKNSKYTNVWQSVNKTYPVPIGKWVTCETYFKEGDGDNGRVFIAITPEGGVRTVVMDVRNFTHAPNAIKPDGINAFNPMKLYTSKDLIDYMAKNGKNLEILWDDYYLWTDKRP